MERVCRLKGINPAKQRLSIVCENISMASEYARIDNEAFRIMRANLPGPFTFVLPASSKLSKAFKGRREVGVRVPDNAIAVAIAQELGNPLLSTTVEWNDADPGDLQVPTSLSMRYEGAVDAIVDGGEGGTEPSAVISLLDSRAPEILREGSVDPIL